MINATNFSLPGAIRAAIKPLRSSLRRFAKQNELAALGSDSARIAQDLHISEAELMHLAGLSPSSADLLDERMKSLELNADAIAPHGPVMRDMQRVCGCCKLKSRCRSDLKSESTAAAVSGYCPNEQTLQALR